MMFERRTEPIPLNRLRMLVYGDAKVGKSSLFAGAENIWYIDTNDGVKTMDVTSSGHITDWKGVQEAYAAVRDAVKDGTGPNAVVIDTINDTFDLAGMDYCQRHGKQSISDFGYGDGYTAATGMMMRFLHAVYDLGVGVYLIAHAKSKHFNGLRGGDLSREMPELPASALREVVTWVDCIMYMTMVPVHAERSRNKKEERYADIQRVLITTAGPHHASGGRYHRTPPEQVVVPPPPKGWERVSSMLTTAFSPEPGE